MSSELIGKLSKIKNLLLEFLRCLFSGVDLRFFVPAILAKYPSYQRLIPFFSSFEKKSSMHMPGHLKKIFSSGSQEYDINFIYDCFVSFFFFRDFVPQHTWAIIDAGAYKGKYTELCEKSVGNDGHIYTIEPNPIFYAELKNKFGDGRHPNIRLFEAALGDEETKTTFYASDEFASTSSFNRDHAALFNGRSREIRVLQMTLDRLLENERVEGVEMAKIDVEGAELRLLMGAAKSLENGIIRRMIIEVHEDVASIAEIKKFLSKYPYKVRIVMTTSARTRKYLYALYDERKAIRCESAFGQKSLRLPIERWRSGSCIRC